MNIAILGSGALARALTTHLHKSGHAVRIGSRTPAGAAREGFPEGTAFNDHVEAAAWADAIVLAVPFGSIDALLPALANELSDKVVIDAINGIGADWQPVGLGEDASVAERVARLLPGSRVVKAFNMIFADALAAVDLEDAAPRPTVFAAGDDPEALRVAADVIEACGCTPGTVAGLTNARYLEAMAHLNISMALAGGGTRGRFAYVEA